MGYKVKVSELAHGDIDEIVSYIAEVLQNETAALRFLDELDVIYETYHKTRSCMKRAAYRDWQRQTTEEL